MLVDPAVEKLAENPAGRDSTLVIDVGNNRQKIIREVRSLDGEILAELPFNTLRIKIKRRYISQLLEVEEIQSIEVERRIQQLEQGN